MKKIFVLNFLYALIFAGCSNSNNDNPIPLTINNEYFNFKIDDVDLSLDTDMNNSGAFNRGGIQRNGDLFNINIIMGFDSSSNEQNIFKIYFDKTGKVIYAERQANSVSVLGYLYYRNYHNFPSNYFSVNIISLDETNKKIKLNFSGELYVDKYNLNSESVKIQGDMNMTYQINEELNYNIEVNSINQYCTAKFNNIPWKAWQELTYSQFTSTDAYRIETHFASDANVGSFNFNQTSTDNYLRFSKFNTATLTYDYFNVDGQIAYSYREFHGIGRYSFIGTFSFTATNPNNPSDIIQVTNGEFRSYQQF